MLNKSKLEESQRKTDDLSVQVTNHITRTCIPRIEKKIGSVSNQISGEFDDTKVLLAKLHTLMHDSAEKVDSTNNFMAELQRWVSKKENVQTNLKCLHLLYYQEMGMRKDAVSDAHKKTFSWIFETPDGESRDVRFNFTNWLQSNDPYKNLFWIAGKPGAGKSTLMKFLANDHRTIGLLGNWAGDNDLHVSQHYFWRSGAPLQRSLEGLMRSLLYRNLRQYPELIDVAFPEKEWVVAGPEFTFIGKCKTLEVALKRLAGVNYVRNLRFCFFIDGLDEFDDRGEYTQSIADEPKLIEFLRIFQNCSWIKLCVSSRPWNAFEVEFTQDSQLYLYMHNLTRHDIWTYVMDTFRSSLLFKGLSLKTLATLSSSKKLSMRQRRSFSGFTLRRGLSWTDSPMRVESII
jgi:hypothetical protein